MEQTSQYVRESKTERERRTTRRRRERRRRRPTCLLSRFRSSVNTYGNSNSRQAPASCPFTSPVCPPPSLPAATAKVVSVSCMIVLSMCLSLSIHDPIEFERGKRAFTSLFFRVSTENPCSSTLHPVHGGLKQDYFAVIAINQVSWRSIKKLLISILVRYFCYFPERVCGFEIFSRNAKSRCKLKKLNYT